MVNKMSDDKQAISNIGQRRVQARNQDNDQYWERRQDILDAAASIFKSQGYRGTALIHIAEQSGIDRASIYYYFSSKEEIFDVLVTGLVKANLDEAESIRDSDMPVTDKLRSLLVGLMESYARHYPLLYIYLQENMRHVAPERKSWADEMRSVNRRWEGAVHEIVEQGLKNGAFRDVGDSWILTYGIIGMVSWTHRWFNPATTAVDATRIGESYAEAILAGLINQEEPAGSSYS